MKSQGVRKRKKRNRKNKTGEKIKRKRKNAVQDLREGSQNQKKWLGSHYNLNWYLKPLFYFFPFFTRDSELGQSGGLL